MKNTLFYIIIALVLIILLVPKNKDKFSNYDVEDFTNPDIIEGYRLRGTPWWADTMKLKARNGLLVDSFGRATPDPRYYPVSPVPYFSRRHFSYGWNPFSWGTLNNWYY
jgi:hypothetical protein